MSIHQSSYKWHNSTETALVYVNDQLLKAVEEKTVSLIVLMDMSKAFDRLDHNYLLTKLRRLGLMPSAAASWFSSYLLFRKQGRVRYEPRFYLRNTSYKTQCRGYPRAQSWVQSYSPCMWMILWMKLVIVKWNCMLMVISSFSSLRYQIQLTPSQVCSTNSLLINPEKTKFIVVGLPPLTSQLPPVSLTVLGISAVLSFTGSMSQL